MFKKSRIARRDWWSRTPKHSVRKHSPEFSAEPRATEVKPRTASQVAQELRIHANLLREWTEQFGSGYWKYCRWWCVESTMGEPIFGGFICGTLIPLGRLLA
jgi:hypothetical protein